MKRVLRHYTYNFVTGRARWVRETSGRSTHVRAFGSRRAGWPFVLVAPWVRLGARFGGFRLLAAINGFAGRIASAQDSDPADSRRLGPISASAAGAPDP